MTKRLMAGIAFFAGIMISATGIAHAGPVPDDLPAPGLLGLIAAAVVGSVVIARWRK